MLLFFFLTLNHAKAEIQWRLDPVPAIDYDKESVVQEDLYDQIVMTIDFDYRNLEIKKPETKLERDLAFDDQSHP